MTTIRYYLDRVYGVTKRYPLDYPEELFGLTNRKTLSDSDLKHLAKLGFTFEQVMPPEDAITR